MAVETSVFGESLQGEEITLYTLTNSKGMKASVTNLGAILVRLLVPDREGCLEDVVLGFDTAEEYYGNPSYFGATIGPSANRIGGASMVLDGVTCQLDNSDGGNNLHSDPEQGYHKRLWKAQTAENSVTFSITDEDGNMGFPGNKELQITYSLNDDNALTLHYHGTSDKKTILNPTNHTYFNLKGHGKGNIEDHELWIKGSQYTPVAAGSIPTGEIADVAGTPMDFTTAKKVGHEINTAFEQLEITGGYDHNWLVDKWDGTMRYFAKVYSAKSGITLHAYTTLPGVQFYAGNFISPQMGKENCSYGKRSGLCLETQYYPDSIHHENFPSCVFGEGREYDSITVYRFE